MTTDNLNFVRIRLKNGEYDGSDIMAAWLAIDELHKLRAAVDTLVAERDALRTERDALRQVIEQQLLNVPVGEWKK
jgi:hypothetical protein